MATNTMTPGERARRDRAIEAHKEAVLACNEAEGHARNAEIMHGLGDAFETALAARLADLAAQKTGAWASAAREHAPGSDLSRLTDRISSVARRFADRAIGYAAPHQPASAAPLLRPGEAPLMSLPTSSQVPAAEAAPPGATCPTCDQSLALHEFTLSNEETLVGLPNERGEVDTCFAFHGVLGMDGVGLLLVLANAMDGNIERSAAVRRRLDSGEDPRNLAIQEQPRFLQGQHQTLQALITMVKAHLALILVEQIAKSSGIVAGAQCPCGARAPAIIGASCGACGQVRTS